MIWARHWIEDISMDDVSGVTMTIHGHTQVDEPMNIGNVHFIDTLAFRSGKLSFIEL
jgi:serine/threonine protein phosphatase 1